MKKIKTVVWSILNILRIGAPIQLLINGYLKDIGWFNSFYTKRSLDKSSEPIPWCTYPYIHFIENRLKPSFSVFEYGAGGSTKWYAQRVKEINSVEHDKTWYEMLLSSKAKNSEIHFCNLEYDGDYSKFCNSLNKEYEVVIVDGRDRNNCANNAVNNLTENGIIVFDNIDLEQYAKSISYLGEKGFKLLEFYGMSPVTARKNCTGIFYRENNCLGI